jgi:cytochrome c peroxidase
MLKGRLGIIYLFVAVFFFLALTAFEENQQSIIHDNFLRYFKDHYLLLDQKISSLNSEIISKNTNIECAKRLLSEVRIEYKSIEGFIIYFLPHESRFLNRAIILEMEKDERVSDIVAPHGFQYIEKLLYSDSVKFNRDKITVELKEINNVLERVNSLMPDITFDEHNIFEAVGSETVRQFTLGMTDFETPQSRKGVRESAEFLNHTREFFQFILPQPGHSVELRDFFSSIDAATEFLSSMELSQSKNYFAFYSSHYIPLSKNLIRVHENIAGRIREQTTPINFKAGSIFDPNAFNTFFFLPAGNLKQRDRIAELGRILFFDPVMSENNRRACASCHKPEKGFTDGLAQSLAFDQDNSLLRNAPTLINSVFQKRLFLDGRSRTYEDQAFRVLSNPQEMHHDFSLIAKKINESPEYISLFRKTYIGTRDTVIDRRSILTAISEYERTLVGMNSKFDKAINGNANLTTDEKEGFNLFVGKGNCASCHFVPLFNGTMPPEYLETEWETLGVPAVNAGGKKALDPDSGRGGIVVTEILRHAFKTPTVRNVEITSPYMHNGVFKTLEEVVDFYDAGGGKGMGLEVPYQTLSPDSLHLSKKEKGQLISFMKSLTDTASLTARPSTLPSFPKNAELNNRVVGGVY